MPFPRLSDVKVTQATLDTIGREQRISADSHMTEPPDLWEKRLPTALRDRAPRFPQRDNAGAVDTFMRGVCGPAYRVVLEKALPGAFDQAVADADTFFGQEQPAVQQWTFGQEEASRITQPVLAVLGAKSNELSPFFGQRQELLLAWFPNIEPFILPDATHLLHVQNPRGMAEGLVAFFARHPLPASP